MAVPATTQTTVATCRPRISVRAQIMIFALLLVVPLMADRVRLLENTRAERIGRSVAEVAGLAERGVEAQSEIIRSTRALLHVVARGYASRTPGGKDCPAFLSDFVTDVPWIKGLSVVGDNGRIVCSTRESAVGLDLSDRDYVTQSRYSRTFVQSDYMIERTAEPTIITAYPVPDREGSGGAVIVAPTELQWVDRFAQMIEAHHGAVAFFLDGRGRVLSALSAGDDHVALSTPDHPLLAAGSGRVGTFVAASVDGVRRIYAFQKLPDSEVSIVVGIDETEALGHVDRDIAFAYLQLILFGLAALMLAWFCGERFIIAPIRALAQVAARIGRGEHAQRLVAARWSAEFAPLAGALNDMAQRLAGREQELQTANQHLEELALMDPLSGLPNRRAFDLRLVAVWQTAGAKMPISLLMIDVDHFKLFNDTYGHIEGDICLGQIGRTLQSVLRPEDLAARFGGEEFVILLPGLDSIGAIAVAERARMAIQALRIRHQAAPSGRVSVSIGLATLTTAEAPSERSLLAAADEALYEAKRKGRDSVAAWTPTVLAKAS